jgi:hypothetical protein
MVVPIPIDLDVMSLGLLEHHGIRYLLHVSGSRDIPSQARLIELEGIEGMFRTWQTTQMQS